jgi:hypothetical protein
MRLCSLGDRLCGFIPQYLITFTALVLKKITNVIFYFTVFGMSDDLVVGCLVKLYSFESRNALVPFLSSALSLCSEFYTFGVCSI